MSKHRRLVLLCVIAVSLTTAVGSGAFSSTVADRGVSVSVAEDQDAYLAIADELQCGVGNGQGQNQNVITNQFGETSLEVSARVSVSSGKLRVKKKGGSSFATISPGNPTTVTYVLQQGESAALQVQPPSGNQTTPAETLQLRIVRAEGSGVEVSVDERQLDVDCPVENG